MTDPAPVYLQCPKCDADVTTMPGKLIKGDWVWQDGVQGSCPGCGVALIVYADGEAWLEVDSYAD